jgi:multidrug efflux pump subunit AcrB
MIQYYVHEKMTLDAAKAYQTIYDTIEKADDELKAKLDPEGTQLSTSFQNFVIYVLNSPYDSEKVDLLNIIVSKYPRELEKNEGLSKYVHKLLTFELMPLNEKEIETQMLSYSPF